MFRRIARAAVATSTGLTVAVAARGMATTPVHCAPPPPSPPAPPAARPAITAPVTAPMQAIQRDVLTFWFGDNLAEPKQNFELWFGGSAETDKLISDKFKPHVDAAARGEYNHWMGDANGALALILLLDQYALNVHRDQPAGYDVSSLAVPVTYTMVGRGLDAQVPAGMRMFCLLPLMHSENLVDQDKCVELHKAAGLDPEFAIVHRDVVAKYGRFPGRNKVHGRISTPAEEQYLKDGGVF